MTEVRKISLLTITATVLLQCLVLANDRLETVRSFDLRTHHLDQNQNTHIIQLETTQDKLTRALVEDKIFTVEELTLASNTNKIHLNQITSTRYIKKDHGSPKRVGNKTQKETLETFVDQENFSSKTLLSTKSDFPCPQAEDIFPCVCTYDGNYNIFLNCTEVESEQQLASVFQQEFPVKDLYQFLMTTNMAIKILGNILNGVTFQRVSLSPGPFVLEAVSEYFLLDSLDVLTFLHIHSSYLNSDLFPFNTLNSAKILDVYVIDITNFTWIPPVRGPLITELSFDVGYITAVEPGTFDGVPNMQILEIQHNAIEELKVGTFPIHEVPTTLKMYSNKIRTVEPGSFYMADSNSSASNADILLDVSNNQIQSLKAGTFFFRDGHMKVDLHNNQISSIEPGTFVMPSVTVLLSIELSLNGNQLTTFDEEVFLNLLPYVTVLNLYGNPLECGCDIAWLVLTPGYMAKVDAEATCDDGGNLHDLDPGVFEAIC